MGHKKRCNQAELARILGVTSPTLTKFKHDPTFPEFDADNNIEIYAGCVWWYLRKEAQPVPSDPDMLAGTESDGLERYRLALVPCQTLAQPLPSTALLRALLLATQWAH